MTLRAAVAPGARVAPGATMLLATAPPPAVAPDAMAALSIPSFLTGEPDGLVALIAPFILSSVAIGLIAIGRDLAAKDWAPPWSPVVNKPLAPVPPAQRRLERMIFETRTKQAISSSVRIGFPAVVAAAVGFVYFDNLALYLSSTLDVETLTILAGDNQTGQFIQNFLVVIDLLFAILAGNAYTSLYQQQEAIYLALYAEVTVAKSLLEQLTLVGQGRPWYGSALQRMNEYLTSDLRRLDVSPVDALSARPVEDPLESIMYMTSIGVPSVVYETVKDLRQARGKRLAAFQRKFPVLGISLLYVLATLEVFAFPLLGAGTAAISNVPELPPVSILELQSLIFASVCGCLVLVLRIIQELWQSSGGVFNIDAVLQQMVLGLEEELQLRMQSQEWLNSVDYRSRFM